MQAFSLGEEVPRHPPMSFAQDGRYVPDILDLIFNLLDLTTLTTVARVCQVWHGIAVDHIWTTLPSLSPLIEHFWRPYTDAWPGEAGSSNEQSQELLRRYCAYAQRVRALHIGFDSRTPAEDSFIAKLREPHSPPVPPLPSLQQLTWTGLDETTLPDVIYFLSPTLKNLDLRMRSGTTDWGVEQLSILFKALGQGVRKLASFRLDTMPIGLLKDENIGNTLAQFLRSQPSLESLFFPHSGVPLSLPTALASLPRLRTFHFLLLSEEFSSIAGFMAELARACPNLHHLIIYGSTHRTVAGCFTFQVISPILACQSLKELQIFHSRPLELTTEQIEVVGQSLPHIETLALCPNVILPDLAVAGTHLSRLPDFGPASFPNLKRLAIYLETLQVPTPFKSRGLTQVEVLCVGSTAVDRSALAEVAGFLASICSPSMVLCNKSKRGSRRYRDLVFDGENTSYQLVDNWADIESLMRGGKSGV